MESKKKKVLKNLGAGQEQRPRCREWTLQTQTWRMDLRTRGGGRVSWDEVRAFHGYIYTTKCKTNS